MKVHQQPTQSDRLGGSFGGTVWAASADLSMLSALKVKTAKPAERAYKLADSGGLFLLVQPNGSKLWRYKFRIGGVEGLQALGAFRGRSC